MKISNKEIGIKIGKKEMKFQNLILNNYIELYTDSFLEFQDKNLDYVAINFTKNNYDINENSTTMNYDILMTGELSQDKEELTGKSIINKYYYDTVYPEYNIKDFEGSTIKQIGFGKLMYNDVGEIEFVLYAYLDVTKYNITIQNSQELIISRTDIIESDLDFYSNSNLVKCPVHLTKNGILNLFGMSYNRILPKLYSIGFGLFPYSIEKEYLAKDLKITKKDRFTFEIKNQLVSDYEHNLYLNEKLLMSEDLKLKKAKLPLIIYKFKLYEETFPNPEEPPVLVDTGKYYVQYEKLKKYGKIDLKIKYERG